MMWEKAKTDGEKECLCMAQIPMNLLIRPQPASVPSVAGISYMCVTALVFEVCVCAV